MTLAPIVVGHALHRYRDPEAYPIRQCACHSRPKRRVGRIAAAIVYSAPKRNPRELRGGCGEMCCCYRAVAWKVTFAIQCISLFFFLFLNSHHLVSHWASSWVNRCFILAGNFTSAAASLAHKCCHLSPATIAQQRSHQCHSSFAPCRPLKGYYTCCDPSPARCSPSAAR